jgi:hypothetical protein
VPAHVAFRCGFKAFGSRAKRSLPWPARPAVTSLTPFSVFVPGVNLVAPSFSENGVPASAAVSAGHPPAASFPGGASFTVKLRSVIASSPSSSVTRRRTV